MSATKLAPGSWGAIRCTETASGWRARVRVRRLDGQYEDIRRTGTTRARARESALDAAEVAAGVTSAGTLTRDSTLRALAEDWRQWASAYGELRPQTLQEQYRTLNQDVLPRIGNVTIAEMTVPIVEGFYQSLLEPRRTRDRMGREYGEPRVMAPAARNALGVLRKVLDRAVILGLRSDNPATAVKPRRRAKKEIHALDASGLQAVRHAVTSYVNRDNRSGPTMKYLEFALDLMSGTGMRIGEALALRSVDDIDLLASPLIVHVTGTIVDYKGASAVRQDLPKTDTSTRSIQVPVWLDAKIRAWMSRPEHADNTLLIETRTGRPVSPDRVQKNLRTVRAWAGLPEWIVSHVMRKSVATAVTDEHGTDHGMYIMGHADLRPLEGHYDKRRTVGYDVTKTLETFDPDRARPQPVPAASVVDPEVFEAVAAAEAEADAVLVGMAAAMGTTLDQLPDNVRVGVRASVLGRIFAT